MTEKRVVILEEELANAILNALGELPSKIGGELFTVLKKAKIIVLPEEQPEVVKQINEKLNKNEKSK